MSILEKTGQQCPLLSYIHLKCIIIICNSVNCNLASKFLCNFIQWNTKCAFFPKNLEKIWLQRPLASYACKNYINVIFHRKYIACKILNDSNPSNPKYMYPKCIIVISNDIFCAYIFVQFHSLETDQILSQKSRKKCIYSITVE